MIRTVVIASALSTATVSCTVDNPNVTGGGFSGTSAANNAGVVDSYPSDAAVDTWTVNLAATDSAWTAYAVCSK